MAKELIAKAFNAGLENIGSERMGRIAISLAHLRYARRLKPEGQEHLRTNIIPRFIRGTPVTLSEEVVLLDGFPMKVEGSGDVAAITGPFMLVGNHYKVGPLEFWHVLATSAAVKQAANQEVRWIMGEGKEIFHQPWEAFHEQVSFVTGSAHKQIARSTDSIYEGDGDVVDKVATTIANGRAVALCPERKQSNTLEQGDTEMGLLLSVMARRFQIPIICVGSWQDADKTLHLQFGKPIAYPKIQAIVNSVNTDGFDREKRREEHGRRVVDYVMTQLAKCLPIDLRGNYLFSSLSNT